VGIIDASPYTVDVDGKNNILLPVHPHRFKQVISNDYVLLKMDFWYFQLQGEHQDLQQDDI